MTDTKSTAIIAVAMAVAVGVALAMVQPLVGQSSGQTQQTAPRQGSTIAFLGFEQGLKAVARLNNQTRLDRVRGGHAGTRHSARMRPPVNQRATVALTDSPTLLQNTHRAQRYHVSVWVRANRAAVSGGALRVRVGLGEINEQGRHINAWRSIRLSGGGWRQVSVPITARHDSHRLDVTVRAEDVRAGGAVFVDDLRLFRRAAPATPRPLLRRTLFGTSIDEGGLDWVTALHRSDRRFGRLDVVRVFDPGLPASWSGRLGSLHRPFAYSFRAAPSAVLAGRYDKQIRSWFRAAPRKHPIWWSYQHEPEDDIEHGQYSATKYRQAWRHINALSRQADNPQLRPTLMLMCWTVNPGSGRRFADYYPGDFIKVLAWDCYNPWPNTGYMKPSRLFGLAARKTANMKKRFAIAEFGSLITPGDDGSRRADWVAGVARFAAKRNAAFVTYWDAKIPREDYQLRELPSRNTWRRVVSAG